MRQFLAIFCLMLLAPSPAEASQTMKILLSPELPICIQIGNLLRAPINSGYIAFNPLTTGNPAHGEKDDAFIRGVYGDIVDLKWKQIGFSDFRDVNQPRLQALVAAGKRFDTDFSVYRAVVDLDGDGHREAVYQLLYLRPNATFGEVFVDNPNSAFGTYLAAQNANYVFMYAGRGYLAQRVPGNVTILELTGKQADQPPPAGYVSGKPVCQYSLE